MLRIQKTDLDSLPSLLIEEKIVGVSDAYFDLDEGFEAMCRLIRHGIVGWSEPNWCHRVSYELSCDAP